MTAQTADAKALDPGLLAFLDDARRLEPAVTLTAGVDADDVDYVLVINVSQRRQIAELAQAHGLSIDSVNATSGYFHPAGSGEVHDGGCIEVSCRIAPASREEVAAAYARALLTVNATVTELVSAAAQSEGLVAAVAGHKRDGLPTTAVAEIARMAEEINATYDRVAELVTRAARHELMSGPFARNPEPLNSVEATLATLLLDEGIEGCAPELIEAKVQGKEVIATYGHLIATAIELAN